MATNLWLILLLVLPCLLIIALPLLAVTIVRLDVRGTARLLAVIAVLTAAIAMVAVIVAAGPTQFGSL